MKNINVILMGANRLAVEVLTDLLEWNIEIKAVVPNTSDNGIDSWSPSLKKFANENNLKVYETDNPNSIESLDYFRGLDCDIIISAHYDKILKTKLLDLPKIGAINFHFSPLPKYRGCYPIHWAIIEGGTAGVTMHWIDKGIDTGNIISKKTIPIGFSKTCKEIYETATTYGRDIFKNFMPRIFNGEKIYHLQEDSESSYFHREEPYQRIIDWEWDSEKIERFVRAFTFPPLMGARTYYNNHEIEILYPIFCRKEKVNNNNKYGEIIEITNDRALRIRSKNDIIEAPHFKLRSSDGEITTDIEVIRFLDLKKGSVLERQGVNSTIKGN
jgi:methionyl-tRNA formyltransferase